MKYGKIHIYTGDGKGKTTAAFGLGLRCFGCGGNVKVVQFLKTGETGEIEALQQLDHFESYRFEKSHGFFWNMDEQQKAQLKDEIKRAYDFCLDLIVNQKCDMLILDEILGAMQDGLLSEEQITDLICHKDNAVEIVLTGRNATPKLIECADYVSNIECVKHPYEKGCAARKGIEF